MGAPKAIDFANECIALRRVTLVDNADRPMNELAASPGTDKVFERYPRTPEKAVKLWLSKDGAWVYVEDRKSGEVEDIPIHFVRQLQRLTERHLEWAKNPPRAAGQVRSLPQPGAKVS
jgi:hypothetical protein